MKFTAPVTFFMFFVLTLVSTTFGAFAKAANPVNTTVAKKPAPILETKKSPLSVSMSISRSSSAVDFQDGRRYDAMDYGLGLSYAASPFNFSTRFAYSQDLHDDSSKTANDWGDVPLTVSMKGASLDVTSDIKGQLSYSVTAIIPQSQNSVKKDQLQTSVSLKTGFSISSSKGGGLTAGVSLSIGQNFHAYEEDINGNVLNKYSSNQGISIGYSFETISLSASLSNRSRMTYKGGTKSSFDISEEISYEINKVFSTSLGHSNSGSTLRANGSDSNIDLYNEVSSVVYVSLGAKF